MNHDYSHPSHLIILVPTLSAFLSLYCLLPMSFELIHGFGTMAVVLSNRDQQLSFCVGTWLWAD